MVDRLFLPPLGRNDFGGNLYLSTIRFGLVVALCVKLNGYGNHGGHQRYLRHFAVVAESLRHPFPKPWIFSEPVTQQMGYGQYGISPDHSRSSIAHDGLDFGAPLGLIAIHGAVGADRLVLLKWTAE